MAAERWAWINIYCCCYCCCWRTFTHCTDETWKCCQCNIEWDHMLFFFTAVNSETPITMTYAIIITYFPKAVVWCRHRLSLSSCKKSWSKREIRKEKDDRGTSRSSRQLGKGVLYSVVSCIFICDENKKMILHLLFWMRNIYDSPMLHTWCSARSKGDYSPLVVVRSQTKCRERRQMRRKQEKKRKRIYHAVAYHNLFCSYTIYLW